MYGNIIIIRIGKLSQWLLNRNYIRNIFVLYLTLQGIMLRIYCLIKGKRLIRQGITEIDGPKKRLFSVRHKGRWYKVRRFRYPIEWRLFPNARSFKISMYNYFFNHTRKEFDDHYKSIYIGERYGLDKSTNVSRGYAVKRTLYRLDGDNEALSDEDVNNLQKKWDNYKTLFINPKDKDKWKKVL